MKLGGHNNSATHQTRSRQPGSVPRTAALALAAGTVFAAASTNGAIINWADGNISGTASTAARWSPAVVPVAADDLVFNATAGTQAYTVTFDAATTTSRTMTFNEDTVTLNMSSNHTTTNGVAIGDVAGDAATVTLSSGTWSSGPSGFVNIGDAISSTGTFTVAGSTAHFAVLGTSDLFVGNNGTGTLSITGTGDVTCNDLMHVGQGAAATGNLTVSGFLAVAPFGISQLTVNGTGESRWGNGGDATVTISNGARAQFAGGLSIGNLSTSTANVTVGGAGLLTDATVDVAGDLAVARNTSAGVLPGTGTLTLNNDSLVSVGGTLHLGNDADGGGTGTININSGALLQATNVIDGANGTINHSGGTLHINGGTYTGHPVPLVVSGTGSPTLRYSGNTVNNLTAAGGVGLRVGDDLGVGTFSGNLIIDSGADVVMSGASNDINIGDDAGTSGEITVTGAGSRLVANQPGDLIRVGFNGSGDLLVSDGGQVIATEIQVPASSLNGDGLLLLEASVSPIVTTNTLSVGNDVGGLGTVTINASGTINALDPGISVLVRETGLLGMFVDSTLNATGTVLIDGGEVRLDGIIHAGTLVDIDSGGLLRTMLAGGTTPLVDGPVRVRSGGVVEAINDNLTMGKSTGTELVQFESGSLVTVGSGRTLTLLDNNNIEADGRIDLQGGTITSTKSIIKDGLAPTDQLVGFGTVDANIRFDTSSGPCAPSGSGLVFSRRLFMNGAFNATGTAIRFAPTSELVDLAAGACNLNCKVTADAGSVMRPNLGNTGAFGPITMGDGTTTGAEIDGILHMGTNGSVTFNDSDGVNVNTVWDMNGGILACPSGGFTVNSNGIVRGNGTIDVGVAGGDQFILLTGGIDPDDYFPATDTYHGIATFFVDGTYVQNVGAEYYCEIAGYDNEFRPLNDRINANAVSLSGTLDVSLINGYVPNLCDEFTIMTYTSRSGAWTNIIEPPGVDVGIRYEATRAVLFFNSVECDGIDFNNDGVSPDTEDINDFLSVFGGGPCSTGNCGDLDFNNDCVTPDTSDIDALLRVFGGGNC